MLGIKFIKVLIVFICLAIIPKESYSQVSKKQIRERKHLLKTLSSKRDSAIIMDETKFLSPEQFLALSEDSISSMLHLKDTNASGKKDYIEVTTVHYVDSINIAHRKSEIKDYRKNEVFCFFGNQEPQIWFGDKSISVKEFLDLPEDTVAFVNFYFSDFVKEYYPSKNKNGIIYVQPRATRSHIKYTKYLTMPANGRNYRYSFGEALLPEFEKGSGTSTRFYLAEKVKEKVGKYDEGLGVSLYVSCVISGDKSIKPILVERVESPNKLEKEQLDNMISLAYEIIHEMPQWHESGLGILYNKLDNQYYYDEREFSVSLEFHFP